MHETQGNILYFNKNIETLQKEFDDLKEKKRVLEEENRVLKEKKRVLEENILESARCLKYEWGFSDDEVSDIMKLDFNLVKNL